MPHRYTVADAYSGELKRRAARHSHTCLYGLCDLVKMDMTGYYFILCRNDTYQRTLDLFVGKPRRLEKRAVRCFFDTFFYYITVHVKNLRS